MVWCVKQPKSRCFVLHISQMVAIWSLFAFFVSLANRCNYLFIFFRAVGEEDASLHVAVEDPLDGGHVTFDNILHLGNGK